ncbi:MAG TPA: hypothetical protein ENI49_06125 [Thermoplasmatales archaeon]|nr:hypothetical protein [Thermoplasmatales archaeon]
MEYRYENWTSYKQDVKLKDGRNQIIYFFTRWKLKRGKPCDLPNGYTVIVNERTRLSYLKEKVDGDISHLPSQ